MPKKDQSLANDAFLRHLDCAGVAAFVTWTTKHPEWNAGKHYKRRLFLKELGNQLVEREIHRRERNPQAMQQQVKVAMKALGRNIVPPVRAVTAVTQPQSSRRRCFLCDRSNDKKISNVCAACNNPCCKNHGEFLCNYCNDN